MSNPFLESDFAPPPSFRKRRPVIFWGGVLLAVFVLYNSVQALRHSLFRGPFVGVIHVEGVILQSDEIVAFADELRQDSAVKAVVVRINSPGGGVAPSQEIHMAIKRLADVKPVVVSMSSMAASGGYYIAVAGKEIYAMPSTLTASIGVKLQVPNAEELMRNIGLSSKTLVTGPFKDSGTYAREMTPKEEAYFQDLIGNMYDEFVKAVAQGRRLSEEEVRSLADGRAMTGRQAMEAGLVDNLGDMHTAVKRAAELGGMSKDARPELLEGPVPPDSWVRDLFESLLRWSAQGRADVQQPQFFY